MFLLGIGKGFDHAAIADTTVATFVDHVLQLGAESRELGNTTVNLDHVMPGNPIGLGAGLFGLRAQV